MAIPDPFLQGIASGWQVQNASLLENDLQLEADVVIVGSGAGGGRERQCSGICDGDERPCI